MTVLWVPANAQRRQISNGFEFVGGIGVSNFSGDLGTDAMTIDTRTLGFAAQAGIRYYFTNRISARLNFSFGTLYGEDSLSSSVYRQRRNLNFKSNIYDAAFLIEYSVLNWNFRDEWSKGKKHYTKRHCLYVFAGISRFKFKPYGEYRGEWYSLQELSTAGQGMPGGASEYKLVSLAIPAGLGYKFKVNSRFAIGAEAVYRKTFTDYIDDVSAPYYNNTTLRQIRGNLAADIADKNTTGVKRPNGDPRGNPSSTDNFTYFLVTFNLKLNAREKANCNIY